MATPTIPNGEEHFFNILYNGNGGGQRIGKFVPFTDNGTIANSVIFNSPDDPKLGKTFSGAGTNTTWTFSCWIKLGIDTSNGRRMIFSAGSAGSEFGGAELSSTGDNSLEFYNYSGGAYAWRLQTNRTLEDRSKWYHLLFVSDTTNSTESDRARIYIDGDRVTSFATASYPSLNYAGNYWMGTTEHEIGTSIFTTQNFDGYMAEVNNVDGSVVLPSTFGVTDTSSGRWVPKALTGITYGTNGFRLQFGSSSNFGDDTSGNTNDFSVSNLVASDQTTDSPTQNHATMYHVQADGNPTFSEGNLKISKNTNDGKYGSGRSTLRLDPKSSTGYYCEITCDSVQAAAGNGYALGVVDVRADYVRQNSSNLLLGVGNNILTTEDSYIVREVNGVDSGTGTNASLSPGFATSDVMQIAFKEGKVWIGKNNTWYNSGNPANGTGFFVHLSNETFYRFYLSVYGTALGAQTGTFNHGQKSFTYTPPTGFVGLNQDNMSSTDKGITGMAWIKGRDTTYNHLLIDSSRGGNSQLQPNLTNGTLTQLDMIQKFLVGGYSVEDFANLNTSGQSYVGWNWVANGGTTATNTTGAITSTVQANTTAGFSIVEYTGTGGAASVGHGLSAAPEWMIFKDKGNSTAWRCYHKSLGGITKYIVLNTTAAVATASMWGAPTASAFIIGGTGYEVNESGNNYIAYCWHSVDGFSRFGSYEGNNSADGPFVYTGFKPAFVMIKDMDNTRSWVIIDSRRDTFNPTDKGLFPNDSAAEATGNTCDLLSNGFKPRSTGTSMNASSTYIYIAFAEHPFVGDGTNPVTAR